MLQSGITQQFFKDMLICQSGEIIMNLKGVSQIEVPFSQRIVYGSAKSPFVFKVLVALAEKDLDFTLIETLPTSVLHTKGETPSLEFVKVSPLGKIPAYQEGDWSIVDSTVIIAYLDRAYSNKPLYPASAKKFAETLWFEKYGDEILTGVIYHKIFVQKIINPKLFGKPTDDNILQQAVNQELPSLLDYLNKELQGKKWITGEDFTAADIAIGIHLVTLKQCEIPISVETYPHIIAYAQRLLERPSFKK